MPDVTIAPETSSRYFAAAAIMARALSLTEDGDCPSAQLIVLSAVAFDGAVRDHFQNDMSIFSLWDIQGAANSVCSLSPLLRGEGWGEGRYVTGLARPSFRGPSAVAPQ